MKVIIQDVDTGEYLSADGSWVADIGGARNFVTLLRAYHFAREKTARNFQVLLHCPDDDYSASIITGMGTSATAETAAADSVALRVPVEMNSASQTAWTPSISVIQPWNPRFRVNLANPRRFHLN